MNLLKKQLVKENYHKETLKITIDMAWPAIVESFFVAFAGLIDSLMVSSLGSYAVAAVGLTTQPKLLGLALFFALNVAISALVARRRGEKKQDSANEILLTAIFFIVIAAIISSIAFVFFASAIIGLCGSTADTHNDAVVYFRIIMGGMIFNCIQMGINAAQRGAGNTKITMRTNVTSNTINIFKYGVNLFFNHIRGNILDVDNTAGVLCNNRNNNTHSKYTVSRKSFQISLNTCTSAAI